MSFNWNQYQTLNQKYELLKVLDESGTTSVVYLGRVIGTSHQVAVKIFREDYLREEKTAWESLSQEISNLMNVKHQGIVALYDYGNSGVICTPAGHVAYKQVFIVMEYVSGGSLWDLTQEMGGIGETAGKFFLTQMLDILEYMHNVKKIVHRDLKPENILVDDLLNIKFADFGFSTNKNIDSLTSFAGSNTYIAPEVKALLTYVETERKPYSGKEADLFSIGVILFLLVKGTFPFLNADEEDFYYSKIITGDFDAYFQWVDKDSTLSAEFKDLVMRLFSPQGSDRPSLDEIREHSWLNGVREEETKSDSSELVAGNTIKQ